MASGVEQWAFGLGMLLAAYWYWALGLLVISIVLIVRKKRAMGIGLIAVTLFGGPVVVSGIWQYHQEQLQPYLGDWAGDIEGVPFALTVKSTAGGYLSGTITHSPCDQGEAFLAELDDESVSLQVMGSSFTLELTGHPWGRELTGQVSGTCGALGVARKIRLGREPLQTNTAKPGNVHSIQIPDCPTPMPFKIPPDFSPASAPSEIELQSTILNALHSNTARRARYSQVFMANWGDPLVDATITFGTLGTTRQMQGKLSPSDWLSLRAGMTPMMRDQAALDRVIEDAKTNYSAGSQADIEYGKTSGLEIQADGPNTMIVFQRAQGTAQGVTIDNMGASKFIYNEKCIVFVIIAVPATIQDADLWVRSLARDTVPLTTLKESPEYGLHSQTLAR